MSVMENLARPTEQRAAAEQRASEEQRATEEQDRGERDGSRAVYAISVVAELVGVEPQSLRLYEARGLVHPARSPGGTRRYSDDDVTRVREITVLLDSGLNLAGIEMVLELRSTNRQLQSEVDRLRG
jgi:MerR family transcriptional regulator/heat shock protein HspR